MSASGENQSPLHKLSFRQTLMLLDMQKQIVAHRSAKKNDLESIDWRRFYEAVKEFLENE